MAQEEGLLHCQLVEPVQHGEEVPGEKADGRQETGSVVFVAFSRFLELGEVGLSLESGCRSLLCLPQGIVCKLL